MSKFQENTRKQIQNVFNKTQGTTQSSNNDFCLLTVGIASKSQETTTQETAEGDFCLNAFGGGQKKKKKKRMLHRKYPTMRLRFGSVMPYSVFQERIKWHSREFKHCESKVGYTLLHDSLKQFSIMLTQMIPVA